MSATDIINCAAQVVVAIAAVVGVIFIIRQLKLQNAQLTLQNEQLKFDALMEIHQRVGQQDFRDALEVIYMATQDELNEPRSKALFTSIRLVAAVFDLLGAGVEQGLFPKQATLKTEWKTVLPLWKRLEGFVKREREHRKLPYKEHFEFLAGEAEQYWKANYPAFDPFHRALPRESKLESAQPMYKGKHLHLHRSANGWEYVSRPSTAKGVTIVAVTGDHEILLVEQYRTPLRKRVIELPAGLVGDRPDTQNETVKDAAIRELREETGRECKAVGLLADGPLLPGLTDETNVLCLADVVNATQARLDKTPAGEQHAELGNKDEGERITVHSIPVDSVVTWLDGQTKAGKAVDLRIYAGLFFLRRERPAHT